MWKNMVEMDYAKAEKYWKPFTDPKSNSNPQVKMSTKVKRIQMLACIDGILEF